MNPRCLVPAALWTLLLALPAPSAAQTVVKLATLVPDGSVWDKVLRETGHQWSQATGGRVTMRLFPGGVAGDEPDIVRKMRIGQIQAGALTTSGLTDIDPAFKVFAIPMFFESYPELLAVIRKLEPTLKQRLEAKGFVLLNWGHGGWVHFFSKRPIQSLDELRRAKMFAWAGDEQMVQVWRAFGFQPVALAATDILPSLQTGMIDAMPTTPLAALSLQWFRATPNMVDVGLAPLVGGIVISKAAWNRISAADRAAILASCKRAESRLEREVPRQDTLAVTEMSRRGLTVHRIPPAQAAEWRAIASSFAAQVSTNGLPPDVLEIAQSERDAFRRARRGER